ncbi:regulator of chromosome condensation 1/beta-lactamase-inhibitor protein II [Fomitopsis serialis]|uniref:regulator of chromosome condensation 1/beta-lactamase-inhibitor protein II n=1 Tax=Fomitopsis serialis TaxID=139415 RepID=UPI002008DC86|nr:regulator of chromosome condensation 1/beta-lactamase-inhibitor protein II [Neoantrodia serialis]KAH9938640.1 regulator of chromosome condensation 1/beta-lactamase-inhibitor protein II [Neoantrodia serialis]
MKKAPATRKPSQRRTTPAHTQETPYCNALPTPLEHLRPAPLLFVWGTGNFGQFGMGADFLGEYDKPTRNKWVERNIEEGIFGGLHSLFWTRRARRAVSIAIPVDENFRAVRITAGDTISAAISSEGDLRVWGSFRGNEGHQFLPASILSLKSRPGNIEKFSSVVAGNNHLIVLTTHGNVYTLGAGEQGQLGRRVLERRKIHGTVPEKIVLGSRNNKAVVVGAGSYSSYAVDEHGTVWAWGLNSMGQTGTGFTSVSADGEVQSPKEVIGLDKRELGGEATVVQIVGGEHHTLFLTSDGRVYSCGRSEGGQLGLADEDEAFKDRPFPDMLAEPAKITFSDANDPIVHISVGVHNNLAVSRGGALYAWGNGPSGELGVSGEEQARTPTVVVRKEGGAWAAVTASCGGQHSLALFRKKT